MITKFFDVVEISRSRINNRSIGFGSISLCLPKICWERLSIEVMLVRKINVPSNEVCHILGSGRCMDRVTAGEHFPVCAYRIN